MSLFPNAYDLNLEAFTGLSLDIFQDDKFLRLNHAQMPFPTHGSLTLPPSQFHLAPSSSALPSSHTSACPITPSDAFYPVVGPREDLSMVVHPPPAVQAPVAPYSGAQATLPVTNQRHSPLLPPATSVPSPLPLLVDRPGAKRSQPASEPLALRFSSRPRKPVNFSRSPTPDRQRNAYDPSPYRPLYNKRHASRGKRTAAAATTVAAAKGGAKAPASIPVLPLSSGGAGLNILVGKDLERYLDSHVGLDNVGDESPNGNVAEARARAEGFKRGDLVWAAVPRKTVYPAWVLRPRDVPSSFFHPVLQASRAGATLVGYLGSPLYFEWVHPSCLTHLPPDLTRVNVDAEPRLASLRQRAAPGRKEGHAISVLQELRQVTAEPRGGFERYLTRATAESDRALADEGLSCCVMCREIVRDDAISGRATATTLRRRKSNVLLDAVCCSNANCQQVTHTFCLKQDPAESVQALLLASKGAFTCPACGGEGNARVPRSAPPHPAHVASLDEDAAEAVRPFALPHVPQMPVFDGDDEDRPIVLLKHAMLARQAAEAATQEAAHPPAAKRRKVMTATNLEMDIVIEGDSVVEPAPPKLSRQGRQVRARQRMMKSLAEFGDGSLVTADDAAPGPGVAKKGNVVTVTGIPSISGTGIDALAVTGAGGGAGADPDNGSNVRFINLPSGVVNGLTLNRIIGATGQGGGCGERKGEGLTPNWIWRAGCRIFGLTVPSDEEMRAGVRIKGLLDPCSNSLVTPNIPAEILYNERMNGLKMSNSWENKYIILNPPFKTQISWRFNNRAIDEVESGRCPGVLILSRASTDTLYFQRMACYPHVFLKRHACRFEDYDTDPIGWGICLFLIVPPKTAVDLTRKFYAEYSPKGNVEYPIDDEIIQTEEFAALMRRQRERIGQQQRDLWIQCDLCNRWRRVNHAEYQVAGEGAWKCAQAGRQCAEPEDRWLAYGQGTCDNRLWRRYPLTNAASCLPPAAGAGPSGPPAQ